jgi:phosphoribulokinase
LGDDDLVSPIEFKRVQPATGAPRPVLLGLAGDSASGKSTLSLGIEYILGTERVSRLCTDDYHRFDRADRAAMGITPLAPEANRMDLMGEQLRALSEGRGVDKPVYDHVNGTFGEPVRLEPPEILIVEGLLPLVSREVREALQVAVYLDPDEELRRRWKLERDVFERGYSPKDVVAEINRREADADAFVRPQRGLADIVVRFHRARGAAEDAPLAARVTVRPTLPYPALRELIGSLRGGGVEPVRWSLATDRRGPMSVLDIDGDCPADLGAEFEDVIWSYLHPDGRLQRDRLGRYRHPEGGERRSEALALAQLLIVSHLVGALDGAFEL